MKNKLIYWSPYIPVIGFISVIFLRDEDLCIHDSDRHFIFSAFTNAIGVVLIACMLFLSSI